jgi:hypothetical protein
MEAFIIEEVHKHLIRKSDTIIHDGKVKTVCVSDITSCEFFGLKLFGDSYRLGHQKVKRIKINNHNLSWNK